MDKKELKLWKKYGDEIAEENSKIADAYIEMQKKITDDNKKLNESRQKRYHERIKKQSAEIRKYDELPFWKQLFTNPPLVRYIPSPLIRPSILSLGFPCFRQTTTEGFYDWLIENKHEL